MKKPMQFGDQYNETLFKVHTGGKVGSWQVVVELSEHNFVRLITRACKVLGGKSTENITEIKQGKNIGRANETSALEQALNEAESKWRKQLDKGYVVEQPEAGSAVTNSLGFKKPMLAKAVQKVAKHHAPYFVSTKLDGHRLLATVNDERAVLYSRQGKIVDIEHIRLRLQHLYDTGSWNGLTLDGEVYIHGPVLQKLSSLIKKPQEGSLALEYHLYDVMADRPYSDRLDYIYAITQANTGMSDPNPLRLVHTIRVEHTDEFNEFHAAALSSGYEGTMIRWGDVGYEEGARSKHLMKKKDFVDAEFKIVGHKLGKPYIRAEDTYQVPVYLCLAENGEEFECTAPGTMEEKHAAYLSIRDDIGKYLTIKYFNLTPRGVPYLPVALQIRNDI